QIVFTGEDELAFLNVDVAFLSDSVPVDGDRTLFEKCVQTLHHDRAVTLSQKLGVIPKIVNMIVWGHRGGILLRDHSRSVVIKKAKRYKIWDLAACDKMRDWWIGLPAGQLVTMSVLSDGAYGAPPYLVFSYPMFIDNARSWNMVQWTKSCDSA
ncbi:hypothetical protein MTO96_038669, partial [Rhipicephalus appendiculatus]